MTENQKDQFKDQGFLILKNLFDEEEIKLLKESAIFDKELDKQSVSRLDENGKKVRLALWNHPGDGIYGMFARC
ncbi:MAG: phytanoyl-CoA dioxygenase family protein, partial [SAR324 cluster bacterium]|nr:phytanoyl-CoA dioxygenase family protein [SAR324 cluster bacterium]